MLCETITLMPACGRYELLHLVRTHLGADDTAFRCVYQQEDDEGFVGVKLAKARPSVAA